MKRTRNGGFSYVFLPFLLHCLLQLMNSDHTHTVVETILEKYGHNGNPDEFCLIQILPDGGRLDVVEWLWNGSRRAFLSISLKCRPALCTKVISGTAASNEVILC